LLDSLLQETLSSEYRPQDVGHTQEPTAANFPDRN